MRKEWRTDAANRTSTIKLIKRKQRKRRDGKRNEEKEHWKHIVRCGGGPIFFFSTHCKISGKKKIGERKKGEINRKRGKERGTQYRYKKKKRREIKKKKREKKEIKECKRERTNKS